MNAIGSDGIAAPIRRTAAVSSILICVVLLLHCGGPSGPPSPPVTISPTSFPNLNVGAPNQLQLGANGGVAPYYWSVSAGSLPHNMALVSNGGTAVISGTPDTAAQGVTFTIQVTDSANQAASQAYTVAVLLNGDLVTISPQPLNFGTQLVGTPSPQQTVTMTNISISPVTISSVATGGTNASEFAQNGACNPSLAPGDSCTITEVFTPSQVGPGNGSIAFTDDTPGSPQSVALNGIGVVSGPNATWSTASLPFGSVAVGDTSLAQSVSLTNYGTSTLNITSITASPDFAETDDCNVPIAPEARCKVNVTFSPTTTGSIDGTLTVSYTGTGSPQAISLSGSGVAGSCRSKGMGCSVVFRCCPGLQCVLTGGPAGNAVCQQ